MKLLPCFVLSRSKAPVGVETSVQTQTGNEVSIVSLVTNDDSTLLSKEVKGKVLLQLRPVDTVASWKEIFEPKLNVISETGAGHLIQPRTRGIKLIVETSLR